MHHLHSVYDITAYSIPLQPLLFLGLVVIVFAYKYYLIRSRKGKAEYSILSALPVKRVGKMEALIAAIFAAVAFGVILKCIFRNYYHNLQMNDSNLKRTVEGRVSHYHPMPKGGHDSERFDVQGVHFEFADEDLRYGGYNNAASRGGAIKPNIYVRIGYYYTGERNVILQLETE